MASYSENNDDDDNDNDGAALSTTCTGSRDDDDETHHQRYRYRYHHRTDHPTLSSHEQQHQRRQYLQQNSITNSNSNSNLQRYYRHLVMKKNNFNRYNDLLNRLKDKEKRTKQEMHHKQKEIYRIQDFLKQEQQQHEHEHSNNTNNLSRSRKEELLCQLQQLKYDHESDHIYIQWDLPEEENSIKKEMNRIYQEMQRIKKRINEILVLHKQHQQQHRQQQQQQQQQSNHLSSSSSINRTGSYDADAAAAASSSISPLRQHRCATARRVHNTSSSNSQSTIPSLQQHNAGASTRLNRHRHRNHDHDHQESSSTARRSTNNNDVTTTMLSSPLTGSSTARIINTEEDANNSAAAQQFRRIEVRHDVGGGGAPHENSVESNNINSSTTYDDKNDKMNSGGSLNSLSLPELQSVKRDWKKQLIKYDMSFARQHGRMPVKAEKEPIRHLHEQYNALKTHIGDMDTPPSTAVPTNSSSAMLTQQRSTDSPVGSDSEESTGNRSNNTARRLSPSSASSPPAGAPALSGDLATLKTQRIEVRHDVGGEEGSPHKNSLESNNINSSTTDDDNDKMNNFDWNLSKKLDEDEEKNNYDGDHDSHTGIESNPIILYDDDDDDSGNANAKFPSGAHCTTISERSKATSSNTSSTSGFGDDLLQQRLYRRGSDCLESLADDRVLLLPQMNNNNATEEAANSVAAAARMICNYELGRANDDSVESKSNNSMDDDDDDKKEISNQIVSPNVVEESIKKPNDDELEESGPAAILRNGNSCTGNAASATLPRSMRSLRSRYNSEPSKPTRKRVGPKFHLLGEMKSRQQHVVMKGTWWNTEKKQDQKFKLICREEENIVELPKEGEFEFQGYCKCTNWTEHEKDIKIRFEKKKNNINEYNITGTGTNSTGIFHLEGIATSTEEYGSYTLKMSKWYVELYYSCTSAPPQYAPPSATAETVRQDDADNSNKISIVTKRKLTESSKKIPKKRKRKSSRKKQIVPVMVGRCVVNNRTLNALDRYEKDNCTKENNKLQRHQQQVLNQLQQQQQQQQQDVDILAGMTDTIRENIAISADSGVLPPQPQQPEKQQHQEQHPFQPQSNDVVNMPSASQVRVPKQQQDGQQLDHHRQVRDERTSRKRYDERMTGKLVRHPDRYIRDPSQFLSSETLVEASTSQRPEKHAIKTITEERKHREGYSKCMLKNKKGEEQCFEEARAAKIGSCTLSMGSSNNNFNLLQNVCKSDRQSSQKDLDDDDDDDEYDYTYILSDEYIMV
jgi:hypothetical protein